MEAMLMMGRRARRCKKSGRIRRPVKKEIIRINPKQRIIIVSAYVRETFFHSVKELGHHVELVQKPFNIDTLIDRIESKQYRYGLKDFNQEASITNEFSWLSMPFSLPNQIYTHSDADVDIGLFPLSPPPRLFDFKHIPVSIIANKETLKDLKIREGDDVFFSGLFESHMGQKKNQPIFRFGKVALISDEKIEWSETKGVKFLDLFLMEFFSFGGNSGSPVFFQPSSESNFAKNHNQSPPIYLAGLVSGSYQRKEVFLPDTYLSQNIGIAAVVPSYKLYEILHSEEVKANRNSGTKYAEYPEGQ
jgi:hypothetical protein